jgi:cyanophycinase
VDPGSRAAASDPDLVAQVEAATGVFMTGGNQLKLSQYVVGTPLGEAILRAHRRGAVVAGTSAGASIMSLFMISMGEEGVTPRQRASQLTAGLGLLPEVVVDQHFDQRARYGRLLSIVATSPNLLGLGIDEDTAAEVTDGWALTVLGTGAVFVVDARGAVSDVPEARRDAPLLVSGAVVHSLPTGATFDLRTATLRTFVERYPDTMVKAEVQDEKDTSEATAALRAH